MFSFKGNEYTLKADSVFLPSEKGSALKGKNLLPWGANSFLLENYPFQKSFGEQESEQ